MAFPQSLNSEQLHSYQSAIGRSIEVRNHFEVGAWLQGDMQHYLPHDILVSAWGNFDFEDFRHDVVSVMAGIHSANSDAAVIDPFLRELHSRWITFGRRPYSANSKIGGFLGAVSLVSCQLGKALQGMRSVIVHGIRDRRSGQTSLYAAFSTSAYGESHRSALALAVPYLDVALRQVEYLPHPTAVFEEPRKHFSDSTIHSGGRNHRVSERESEVLHWVALGKTNPEIGLILGISEFTVKNHLQRLFRKLEVTNRAQAVARLGAHGVSPSPAPRIVGNVAHSTSVVSV